MTYYDAQPFGNWLICNKLMYRPGQVWDVIDVHLLSPGPIGYHGVISWNAPGVVKLEKMDVSTLHRSTGWSEIRASGSLADHLYLAERFGIYVKFHETRPELPSTERPIDRKMQTLYYPQKILFRCNGDLVLSTVSRNITYSGGTLDLDSAKALWTHNTFAKVTSIYHNRMKGTY